MLQWPGDIFKYNHQGKQVLRASGESTKEKAKQVEAYTGCKVAEKDGLLAAQKWMRHASYATTERHYGRYINKQVGELTIEIPETKPQTFTPVILSASNVS